MHHYLTQFASEEATSGIGALGFDVKAFVFQLITFLIIVLFLKKVAIDKLFRVIDQRRQEILAGLERAEAAKAELVKAEEQASKIVAKARQEAEQVANDIRKQALLDAGKTEEKASQKVARLTAEAQEQLAQEVQKAEAQLRIQTAQLVADVSEKVLQTKIDSAADKKLIEEQIAVVAGEAR